jgi:hypothetical protein
METGLDKLLSLSFSIKTRVVLTSKYVGPAGHWTIGHLISKVEKNKCVITPSEFEGCYSCFTGAKLNFACKTDFGQALAHVQCRSASFSTKCMANGFGGVVVWCGEPKSTRNVRSNVQQDRRI